jgi:tetratricopeptide (TPR) repeat protein
MNTKEKVLIHKGMDRVRRMEYDEALEIFDKVLDMNPEISEAWNNRGVALFRLGRAEEAIESYNRALAIEPQNLDALRNKGFVLRSQGRLEEALECYEAAARAGGDALDMEAIATVLVGLGRPEEALVCLQEAMKITPLERFEEEMEVLRSMILQRDMEQRANLGGKE